MKEIKIVSFAKLVKKPQILSLQRSFLERIPFPSNSFFEKKSKAIRKFFDLNLNVGSFR